MSNHSYDFPIVPDSTQYYYQQALHQEHPRMQSHFPQTSKAQPQNPDYNRTISPNDSFASQADSIVAFAMPGTSSSTNAHASQPYSSNVPTNISTNSNINANSFTTNQFTSTQYPPDLGSTKNPSRYG